MPTPPSPTTPRPSRPKMWPRVQVFANPKYAGRISMPDNTDDVWSLAFLATGVTSWDNVTDEQFTAAADWLRAVHPNVRAYWADPSELSQLMASGEVQVAWSWNDPVAILQVGKLPRRLQPRPGRRCRHLVLRLCQHEGRPGQRGQGLRPHQLASGPHLGPAAAGCDRLCLGQRRRDGRRSRPTR